MGKGTSTNFGSDWFGWLQSMHDWGPHESHGAPKPGPSGNSGNSGGATGPTTTLTVTFNSEEAGYASAMGWYNARTGEAGVLFKNTNDEAGTLASRRVTRAASLCCRAMSTPTTSASS